MIKVRTFICIEIPANIRSKIAELQTQLKSEGNGVSWTRPEGIHLTLKFLGDVEQKTVADIAQAVETACAHTKKFSIVVGGVGAFPNFSRPRVLWIGIHDSSKQLAPLQRSIELELEKLGFPREQRDFSPHLTIARIKFHERGQRLAHKLQTQSFTAQPFEVAEVIVMRSELNPNGAIYTPMNIIRLKE